MLLLTQPTVRTRLAQNGRQYVLDRYSWNQVDERLFAALA
jgi:hypothetical protein